MSTNFISPVARLVQGSMSLHPKVDQKGQPVIDTKTGQQVQECFLAIAIPKTDPQLGAFYALIDAQARASFPQLFPNGGACTHPQFAFKVQDGDGVDSAGQSVAGKPGFAGNYIFKMATRYAPRCFHYGKYDPSQQIQNPDEVIKKGYYIRVSGTIDGNGVVPGGSAKPGVYVSPNMVELVAFGEEIVSGPDAAAIFGAAPVIGALPAGASAAPILPHGTGAAPALPGLPGAGVLAPPGLPGAVAAPAGLPPMPGAVHAPVYEMQPSAQGATREALQKLGWTDDLLVAQGHMIIR